MTKVAVIYTGHMRSFERCWPTHQWHVLKHFPDAKFFISTVRDADSHKSIPNAIVEVVDKQPEFAFERPWSIGRFYTHEPYAISVSPQAVVAQLWQLEQGFKLYLKNTDEKDLADIVIRIRPDLYFHSFDNNGGYNQPNEAHTPWWGKFGGVNDRFSIMGRDAADHYFFTFSKIEKLRAKGCPLHPESLIRASLEDGHCVIHDNMRVEFSTLRTTGEMRAPEISINDLAHLMM